MTTSTSTISSSGKGRVTPTKKPLHKPVVNPVIKPIPNPVNISFNVVKCSIDLKYDEQKFAEFMIYGAKFNISDKNGIKGVISTITMRDLLNPVQYFAEMLGPKDKETDSMIEFSIKNVFIYLLLLLENCQDQY